MSVVISTTLENGEEWRSAFLEVCPDLAIFCWGDESPPPLESVEFAIIAKPHAGVLEALPNLRAIFSLWAGVEASVGVKGFPLDIPLYRMVDRNMAAAICEYVVGHIYISHLQARRFMAQQEASVWDDKFYPRLASECIVGVMGAGAIGSELLRRLRELNFGLRCWSRSKKNFAGVESFVGDEELNSFLQECDYLVSLLPMTEATRDLMDSEFFSHCKSGCYLVNVGRGEQIVEQALLAALDSERLSGACLDVFRAEPLPTEHPFWHHPKIELTPHIAGVTPRHSGAAHIADLMRRIQVGEKPQTGLYNPRRGY